MMRSPLKSKKSSFIPQYWTRTITTSVMSGFLLRTLVSNLKSMSNVYISTIRLYCNQIFFKPRSWQKSWPGRALDKCPGQSGRPQGWQGCRGLPTRAQRSTIPGEISDQRLTTPSSKGSLALLAYSSMKPPPIRCYCYAIRLQSSWLYPHWSTISWAETTVTSVFIRSWLPIFNWVSAFYLCPWCCWQISTTATKLWESATLDHNHSALLINKGSDDLA